MSRLTEARSAPGVNALASDANLLRREQFTYDRAGNRTQQSIALNGAAPTVTNYTYNAGNQLTNAGAATLTYDNNGNLTTYTWDRANRMISGGGATYAYDGLGNRLMQTVGSFVTNYLNDLQPGLAVVLRATQGANTDQYVYSPRGIHEQQTNGQWYWAIQDGLGSVRGMSNSASTMVNSGSYDSYGVPYGTVSGVGQMHGFTGEATNANGDLFLRARHYRPAMGVFASQDPLETMNRYAYVEGNVINRVDPSGLQDVAIPMPMSREEFLDFIKAGSAAVASLCTGPQAVACAAISLSLRVQPLLCQRRFHSIRSSPTQQEPVRLRRLLFQESTWIQEL